MTCSVDGCDRPVHCRRMCGGHYQKARRRRAGRRCSVDGCEQRAESKGFCSMHYARAKRHGDPLMVRGQRVATPAEAAEAAKAVARDVLARASVKPAVAPVDGATPVVCPACGRAVVADDTAEAHVVAAAMSNHRRYCRGGREETGNE